MTKKSSTPYPRVTAYGARTLFEVLDRGSDHPNPAVAISIGNQRYLRVVVGPSVAMEKLDGVITKLTFDAVSEFPGTKNAYVGKFVLLVDPTVATITNDRILTMRWEKHLQVELQSA
jgi:hypothetical protein